MNDSYGFIDAEKETITDDGDLKYTVTKMCHWLEVSTSSYYEWRDRVESVTAKRRARLGELVAKAFGDSEQTYGHRRSMPSCCGGDSAAHPNWSAASCATWAWSPASRDPAATSPRPIRRPVVERHF